jgi:uncharacterized membrane protein
MSTAPSSMETGPDLGVDHTPQPDDQRATAHAGDQQANATSRPRLRVWVSQRALTIPAEAQAALRVWAPPAAHESASDQRRASDVAGSRLRALLPVWAGLVAIVALEPFRAIWPVALVLTALTLTVPGIVALRALRVSGAALVRYPLYIPAASLAVVMAGGLAGDLLGPLLGDAHPLSDQTAALSVLLLSFLLSLAGTAAPTAARFPWREAIRRPELLLPLALPLLAAGGALLLNNGHGAGLARFTAAAGIFVLLGCLVRADRMSRASVAMLLFACALAAEWAFSLRSQEIVGYDISSEIHIAQQTLRTGVWHTAHSNDPYGAMLSLTVLPATLAHLTGLSPLISFKVLYPVITALLPVSVYLVSERFLPRRFAALAAVLIIVQSYFFQLLPALARQEIGLLFFAALVAALLDEPPVRGSRLGLMVLASLGLVVSHYSSTYLAIPLVLTAIVLCVLLRRVAPIRGLLPALVAAAILLIGGVVVWDGVITHSTSNLTSFSASVEDKGLNLLPTQHGGLVTTFLSGNALEPASGPTFERAAVNDYRDRSRYIHPLPAASQARYRLQTARVPAPKVRSPTLSRLIQLMSTVEGELMLLAGGLGALLLTVRRRVSPVARSAGVLALGTLVVLFVIRFSGTAAAAYNQPRALLQSLIVLAPAAAYFAERVIGRLGRLRSPGWLALLGMLGLVFAFQNGVSALAVGGGTSLNLSQSGEDFEREYSTPAELAGAAWANVASRRQILDADRYGQLRLFAATGRVVFTDLTPETIDRNAWVYGNHTNVVLGRARGQVGNYTGLYRWPSAFLDRYFNTVYTDGDSEVFHR